MHITYIFQFVTIFFILLKLHDRLELHTENLAIEKNKLPMQNIFLQHEAVKVAKAEESVIFAVAALED